MKRGLAFVDVASPLHSKATVNLMTTVPAVAADDAVKSGFDGCDGIFSFAQNPNLEHVTGFPVVARGFKAGGDHDTGVILMKEKAVQRAPPTRSSATQSARAEITRNAPIKSARAVRKGFRGFMI